MTFGYECPDLRFQRASRAMTFGYECSDLQFQRASLNCQKSLGRKANGWMARKSRFASKPEELPELDELPREYHPKYSVMRDARAIHCHARFVAPCAVLHISAALHIAETCLPLSAFTSTNTLLFAPETPCKARSTGGLSRGLLHHHHGSMLVLHGLASGESRAWAPVSCKRLSVIAVLSRENEVATYRGSAGG
jgi:hypothetical protein